MGPPARSKSISPPPPAGRPPRAFMGVDIGSPFRGKIIDRGGKVATNIGDVWHARWPQFAKDDGTRVDEIIPPELIADAQKHLRPKWVPAPATSHLLAFAFVDSRRLLNWVVDGQRLYTASERLPDSAIYVKFKQKGRNTNVVMYGYFSPQHALLADIYGAMLARDIWIKNQGPGVVVHAMLEKNPHIRYQQVSAAQNPTLG